MKRALTGIAAVAIVLGSTAPMAFAASTINNNAKVIGTKAVVVNGQLLSNPYEMTAIDSGNTTAYFGIHYFDSAINALGTGFSTSWDGNNHIWHITAPGLDASKIAGGVGTGNTTIVINGVTVKKINTFSHLDPAGGKNAVQTTYFPVFYVNEILAAIGVTGNWNASLGLTVSSPVAVPFAVKNVTAVDAEHVVVNFTHSVNAAASTASNYTVSGAAVSSAAVSADGKSVTLTLNAPLTNNTGYAVTINKNVQDTHGDTLTSNANYVAGFYFADNTAPSVASMSAAANGDLQIQFSEPLDPSATPAIVIDGTTIANGIAVSGNTVTVAQASLPAAVKNNSTNSIMMKGAKDLVGNEMSLYQANFNYVIPDAVAPAVTSLTASSENTLTVKFNKPIVYSHAADLGLTITQNGVSVTPTIATTDNQTFTITLPSSIYKNSSTANLNVAFKGFKDVLNHIGTEYSQAVTMNEDTAAPALTSAQYDSTNNEAVFNFNKALDAATIPTSDLSIVNDGTGVPVTNFAVKAVSQDATAVDVTGLPAGTYSVTFKSDTVKADTILQTGNAGFNTTLTVPASTTAATVTSAQVGKFAPNSSETIAVTFSAPVHGGTTAGSATNLSSYQLNGQPLPAGTAITLNAASTGVTAQTVATISLPAGSIAKTATEDLNISGIQDMNGNAVPTADKWVNVTDNTAPVLQSAAVDSTTGDVVLTFSEAVQNFKASDFVVEDNGTQVSVKAAAGSASNEVVLTPSGASLATGTVTVATASKPSTTDTAGNNLVGGTTVTATR
ncbi:Ig-like domain-containing protein [Alicyclobacillus tolerans]|uniref:Ig-like domain-containing protein n=1 Tax=Alicyclobacillus tolerans TaxID=90970 RepID=UPI001F25644E|nr:Ig-like domain-containing protein [Alicyclobacillus tolerans]MCF8565057.1 Ig-like domain-containing protein [Alicyclobacillus tolerans]